MPAAQRQHYGVPLVADLPVGQHLQDQPMYTLLFAIKPEAPSLPADGSGALWTRSAGTAKGDLDIQLSVSVMANFSPPGEQVQLLRIWAAVVLPVSAGTVGLKSRDPRITPAIEYNLLAEPLDRRLLEAVKLARRLARTALFADFIEQEIHPGPDVQTDKQLSAALDANLTTYHHGCGSAPVGGDHDPAAVVDGQGRVRQVLRPAHGRCQHLPRSHLAPINFTVLMVAERIAAAMN